MNGMFEQIMQTGAAATVPARLDRQETMLTAHLDGLKALKAALEPLYASLSGEQKKVADGLMIRTYGHDVDRISRGRGPWKTSCIFSYGPGCFPS
jgi:hypothetical protein